jgi:hypothetical protein
LIFYLQWLLVVLIKILFVAGQDSNLHELYSVLVSTFTGIMVILRELAGLSYLPLIYLTCLTDELLIIHSRPVTLAYASVDLIAILQDRDITLQGSLVLQVRTVLLGQRNNLSYSTNLALNLPHLIGAGYLDSAL